jgi:hypothetical protein
VRPRSIHHDRPRAGELRPGVIAEFDDPRDRYDASGVLATLRKDLQTSVGPRGGATRATTPTR